MIDSAYRLQPKEDWYAFLKAPRFWVMLIGCFSIYFEAKDFPWFGEAERNLVASIAAMFITVKTLDRTVDRLGKI